MQVEKFIEQGRRKRIERRLSTSCAVCGDGLGCGAQDNPWTWMKSATVMAWLQEHRIHCDRVGVRVEFVDVDED